MIIQRLKDGRLRDANTGRILKDADIRVDLEKLFQNLKLNDKFITRKISPWDKFGNESKKMSSASIFRLQKAGSLYLNGNKPEAMPHFKAVIENSKNVVLALKKGMDYMKNNEPGHFDFKQQKEYMNAIKRFEDQIRTASAIVGKL